MKYLNQLDHPDTVSYTHLPPAPQIPAAPPWGGGRENPCTAAMGPRPYVRNAMRNILP